MVVFYLECTQITCILKLVTLLHESLPKYLPNVYFEHFLKSPKAQKPKSLPKIHVQIFENEKQMTPFYEAENLSDRLAVIFQE